MQHAIFYVYCELDFLAGIQGCDMINVCLGLQNATGWGEGAWHLHMDQRKLIQELNRYTLPGYSIIHLSFKNCVCFDGHSLI